MIADLPSLGIRFDIDKLGGGLYGIKGWEIFWRCVGIEGLATGTVLYDGDSEATLNGSERVWCIGLQNQDETVLEGIKTNLSESDEVSQFAATPMFAEGDDLLQEPLLDAGKIDDSGELECPDYFSSRTALEKLNDPSSPEVHKDTIVVDETNEETRQEHTVQDSDTSSDSAQQESESPPKDGALFEVERDAFLEGFSKAVPVTERRSPKPILSHVLMETRGNELELTATDLEVGVQMRFSCTAQQDLKLAVPAKKMHEILRAVDPGTVQIKLFGTSRLKVLAGNSEFQLAGMDAWEFPAWADLEGIRTVPVPARTLLRMLEKTLFASSNDESRFNLNAILFEDFEDKVRLVATDGHRLAMIDESLGISLGSKMLVPKKGVLELRRILETLGEEIQLGFQEKNMLVATKDFAMTIRLVEGDYPDYRKVIPSGGIAHAIAERAGILQAVRRVKILTSERNKSITLSLSSNSIELTAVHPDLGQARDRIECESEGEDLVVIVNVDYLVDALEAAETDQVRFVFHKERAPIVVQPEPSQNYFSLVMPMRK